MSKKKTFVKKLRKLIMKNRELGLETVTDILAFDLVLMNVNMREGVPGVYASLHAISNAAHNLGFVLELTDDKRNKPTLH